MARRGVALVTVLSLGVLLLVLTTAVFAFVYPHYRAHRLEQQRVQAYWNARSGLESYLAGSFGSIQSGKIVTFPGGTVSRAGNRLVFEGQAGSARERFVFVEGTRP